MDLVQGATLRPAELEPLTYRLPTRYLQVFPQSAPPVSPGSLQAVIVGLINTHSESWRRERRATPSKITFGSQLRIACSDWRVASVRSDVEATGLRNGGSGMVCGAHGVGAADARS